MNAAASYHQPRPPCARTTSSVGEVAQHREQVSRGRPARSSSPGRSSSRSAPPAGRRARLSTWYAGYSERSSQRKPPCTGCSLSAAAPRSSCRVTSSAIGKCRCGLTLAIGRNRAGLLLDERQQVLEALDRRWPWGCTRRSSSATSTPCSAKSSSSLAGRGTPVAVPERRRGCRSGPKSRAHCTQAGFSDPSTGTWTWASMSRWPSSIGSHLLRRHAVSAPRSPTLRAPPGSPSGSSRPSRTSTKKARLSSTYVSRPRHAPVLDDRLDRAHRLAGAAVDALLRVDVALAPPLVDAVDRALLDARLVVDVHAGAGDDVGHGVSSSVSAAAHLEPLELAGRGLRQVVDEHAPGAAP